MNEVLVHSPEWKRNRLRLRWEVSPASPLYTRSECELVFPDEVNLENVPPALLMKAALLCLHSHWVLMNPCRVRLPVSLTDAETMFWTRLMEAQFNTMEAHRVSGDPVSALHVELEGSGPLQNLPQAPCVSGTRCASAFSGGKDSLFQAGVLSEISELPLLVATTSPMPPLQDHQHPKRLWLLEEIARRRRVQVLEVRSNCRSCWNNLYPSDRGYGVAVNEVADTYLYLTSLLLCGAAMNVPHLFLASENEVNDNSERDGKVIQHPHAMYSVAGQRSLNALLAPWGFSYCSLTAPLHSGQIQHILWNRYPDLRAMQFSCWAVTAQAPMCNSCSQCLRIALTALANGFDPAEMGADLEGALISQRNWETKARWAGDQTVLPKVRVSGRLHAQMLDCIRRLTVASVAAYLVRHHRNWLRPQRIVAALRSFTRMKRLADQWPSPGWQGYRPGYLDAVDPLVRLPLRVLVESYFQPEPLAAYRETLDRTSRLASWIAESLNQQVAGLNESVTPSPGGPALDHVRCGTVLLGIIVRSGFVRDGIEFFTPPAFSQQMAYMNRPAGYAIPPHVHLPVHRALEGTQEALFIRKGRVRIDFYDQAQAYVVSRILVTGDVVLLAGGGHGFEMLEPTEMIEVKQGPYDRDADKKRFEPVAPDRIRTV